ncbi:pyrroline-5-carboxylate reductase [Pasteurellaceae bacterium HPA106]|uniref:pyrroline-5-carboxylate reductase n=1 Tax=Spirabiliibacterium pneumoniae TaxID=221400 RepID=UPI001AADB4DC|nr:pyrroline-5-carboxylate reductase [Spirabiliibacterium pneumoniae]MBE2897065.1 pyrroline-5-carboxylate reductase [Spirabiliibacterium pneumoniae]
MENTQIAFIGAGNMSNALMLGLLRAGVASSHMMASNPSLPKLTALSPLGIHTTQDNAVAARFGEVVVLAVKPQMMAQACQVLSPLDFSQKLVISIAAGMPIARLKQLLPSANAVVRAMPNTPALLQAGMTGLFANDACSAAQKALAQAIFDAVGRVCWLDKEDDINVVTAGAGSSPAYFFYVLEAMQTALLQMGLDESHARTLIEQAMAGAAKMVIENPQLSLGELCAQVTSKGGTTAAAIAQFEKCGLAEIIAQGMQQASARAREMEQQL